MKDFEEKKKKNLLEQIQQTSNNNKAVNGIFFIVLRAFNTQNKNHTRKILFQTIRHKKRQNSRKMRRTIDKNERFGGEG